MNVSAPDVPLTDAPPPGDEASTTVADWTSADRSTCAPSATTNRCTLVTLPAAKVMPASASIVLTPLPPCTQAGAALSENTLSPPPVKVSAAPGASALQVTLWSGLVVRTPSTTPELWNPP